MMIHANSIYPTPFRVGVGFHTAHFTTKSFWKKALSFQTRPIVATPTKIPNPNVKSAFQATQKNPPPPFSSKKSLFSSLADSTVFIKNIANDIIRGEVKSYLSSAVKSLSPQYFNEFTLVIEEFDGYSKNQVFEAAETYLGTKMNPNVRSLKVSKAEKEKNLSISMLEDEEILDVFDGIRVKWHQVTKEDKKPGMREDDRNEWGRGHSQHDAEEKKYIRYYELKMHLRHKDKVLNSYLPYVLNKAKAIREERRILQLHTVDTDRETWNPKPIDLVHPMTFETFAMDSELKKVLLDDLNEFVQGKEFYNKIGKAWKRGYLLYCPPGTGKSSLIAAMANYLNYDIYDLDLTDIYCNADLRSLLLSMSSRSILVIEDIDCTIKIYNRNVEDGARYHGHGENKVTLSGILNFIDGLWSCCGEEHIIVLTTNHKDRLDPALLRPGRMDMHIHMSYCTISAFKQLAFNYLGIRHHKLFEQIEGLIGEINVSPAEVAGELVKSTDAEVSLRSLVKFLHNKKTIELQTTETKEEEKKNES